MAASGSALPYGKERGNIQTTTTTTLGRVVKKFQFSTLDSLAIAYDVTAKRHIRHGYIDFNMSKLRTGTPFLNQVNSFVDYKLEKVLIKRHILFCERGNNNTQRTNQMTIVDYTSAPWNRDGKNGTHTQLDPRLMNDSSTSSFMLNLQQDHTVTTTTEASSNTRIFARTPCVITIEIDNPAFQITSDEKATGATHTFERVDNEPIPLVTDEGYNDVTWFLVRNRVE